MRVRRLPPVSVPSRQGRRADKGADAAVQRRIRGADVAGFVLAICLGASVVALSLGGVR